MAHEDDLGNEVGCLFMTTFHELPSCTSDSGATYTSSMGSILCRYISSIMTSYVTTDTKGMPVQTVFPIRSNEGKSSGSLLFELAPITLPYNKVTSLAERVNSMSIALIESFVIVAAQI